MSTKEKHGELPEWLYVVIGGAIMLIVFVASFVASVGMTAILVRIASWWGWV